MNTSARKTWLRRGLGRTEVIVIVSVVAAVAVVGCLGSTFLAGLLLPALGKARQNALSLKDKAQLREMHQAMALLNSGLGGDFPTPGLVVLGGSQGEEDYGLNHSANLYSLLVAQNYVSPEILVGTTEVNPSISVKLDYDYGSHDPAAGVFWDPTFVMHIHDPSVGANGSYAHLAFVGDRRDRWRNTMDPAVPIFATRGVENGLGPGNPEYDRSPTLRLHGSPRQWVGHLVFNDNHTETWSSPTISIPSLVFDDGSGPRPDNIFAAEFDHPNGRQAAGDVFLGVFISATEFTVQDVYDPLE